MRQSIQQGRCHLGIAEHGDPVAKRQIGVMIRLVFSYSWLIR